MIADIKTILWKEFKEMLYKQPASSLMGRGGWISAAVVIALLGILLPIEAGEEWVSNPIHMVWFVWLPFLMVSYIVGDTFAGERERHTLETLLASRLSDKTILFGKIAGSVIYGYAISIAGLIVSLITVNIAAGKGHLLMFSPVITLAVLVLIFLFTLLSSVLGVFISLRASTVRQAQQTLGLVGMIPILPVVISSMLSKDALMNLIASIQQMNSLVLVLALAGIFLVIDLVLISLAMKRFQRAKLILD